MLYHKDYKREPSENKNLGEIFCMLTVVCILGANLDGGRLNINEREEDMENEEGMSFLICEREKGREKGNK